MHLDYSEMFSRDCREFFCAAARDAACFAALERHLVVLFASAAPKTPIEHHHRWIITAFTRLLKICTFAH